MAYGSVPDVNCSELKIENIVNATGASNEYPLALKIINALYPTICVYVCTHSTTDSRTVPQVLRQYHQILTSMQKM